MSIAFSAVRTYINLTKEKKTLMDTKVENAILKNTRFYMFLKKTNHSIIACLWCKISGG
jgi:hypothetical protein